MKSGFRWAFILCITASAAALDTSELVERQIEALGGRTVLLGLSDAYIRYDVQVGRRVGVAETWSQAPDRTRLTVRLPGLRQEKGSDGRRRWDVSPAGQITLEPAPKPGRDRPMVLPELAYLFDPEIRLTLRGSEVRDDRREYLLLVQEEGRADRTLRIDAETYLIRRLETRDKGLDVRIDRDDYRPVQGVMIPHEQRQSSTLEDAPAVIFRILEARFNQAPDPSVFLPPEERTRDFQLEHGDRSAPIPFDPEARHIILQTVVAGSDPVPLLLDSASGVHVLSHRLAERLELASTGETTSLGIGGEHVLQTRERVEIRIGGSRLFRQPVCSADLGPLREHLDVPIEGILGVPLFSPLVVRIDHGTHSIQLLDPDRFEPPADAIRLAGRRMGGLLEVEAVLEGRSGFVRVDTGSDGALHLHRTFVDATGIREDPGRRFFPLRATDMGGEVDLLATRIGQLRLGTLVLSDVPAYIALEEATVLNAGDALATLGRSILRRCVVTLDFPGDRLLLEPVPDADAPFRTDRSGVVLRRRDGHLEVHRVLPGSPAEGKLLPGDRLLRLKRRRADRLTLRAAREILKGSEGERVRIKVLRDGRKRRITLILEELY